jgi:hypothetical protein
MHICITLVLFRNCLSQLLLHFVSNTVSESCLTVLFLCEPSIVVMICFTPDAVACCNSCISTPETHRVSMNSVSTKYFVYTKTPLKGQTVTCFYQISAFSILSFMHFAAELASQNINIYFLPITYMAFGSYWGKHKWRTQLSPPLYIYTVSTHNLCSFCIHSEMQKAMQHLHDNVRE